MIMELYNLEKQDHKIQKFFRKLNLKFLYIKKLPLMNISSEVFLQIDGNKTVKEIGENLEVKYGEKVNPLYERLLFFLIISMLIVTILKRLIE